MSKKKTITTSLIAIFLVLAFTVQVSASTQIDWPTSPVTGISIDENSEIGHLIAFFYGWAIGIAIIIAFLTIVFGGVEYMLSGISGNPSLASRGLGRVKSAVLGLTLALSSWVILNTINPQITSLQPLPNLWDVDGTLENTPRPDNFLSEPPCEYVLFYPEEDFQGASPLRQTPGMYIGDAVGYKSVRGFRKITDDEKLSFAILSESDFKDPRHIDGNYIETNSCSMTLYTPTSILPWSDKCGRPSTVVTIPSRAISKSVFEDVGCYEISTSGF